MKKIACFFVFIFIFVFFGVADEEIKIPTSRGEKTLIIPEDYDDLREAFIEMSMLYVEERYAHEDTSARFETVTDYSDDLYDITQELGDLSLNITDLLEDREKDRAAIDVWRSTILLGGGFDFAIDDATPKVLIGYGGTLLETVTIQILLQYPPLGPMLLLGFQF